MFHPISESRGLSCRECYRCYLPGALRPGQSAEAARAQPAVPGGGGCLGRLLPNLFTPASPNFSVSHMGLRDRERHPSISALLRSQKQPFHPPHGL